jgi:regulator of nonsense transcripts 2
MDVDFMITDTLEMLRPQLSILASYEEANEAVDRMLLEQLKSVQGADGTGKPLLEDGFEESEGSDTSSGGEEDDLDLLEAANEEESESEANVGGEGDEEEDVVVLKNKKEELSREEEEEFEREYSKMMSESIDSRKFEKKAAMLDVAIPMHLRGSQGMDVSLGTSVTFFNILHCVDRRTMAQDTNKAETGKMAFTLLTKKGNRQQV